MENIHYTPRHTCNYDSIDREPDESVKWVVMRSLQSKVPVIEDYAPGKKRTVLKYGYENAENMFFEFFMPVKEHVTTRNGRKIITHLPAIPGIFFIRDTIPAITSMVNRRLGFEFKFIKGRKYQEPVVINDMEMTNFINALECGDKVKFFSPDDIRLNAKLNHRIRIHQNGSWIEGILISVRGSKQRRLRVSVENCLVAEIDIDLNSLKESGQIIELID